MWGLWQNSCINTPRISKKITVHAILLFWELISLILPIPSNLVFFQLSSSLKFMLNCHNSHIFKRLYQKISLSLNNSSKSLTMHECPWYFWKNYKAHHFFPLENLFTMKKKNKKKKEIEWGKKKKPFSFILGFSIPVILRLALAFKFKFDCHNSHILSIPAFIHIHIHIKMLAQNYIHNHRITVIE